MVTWEEVSKISQNGIINQYEVFLESTQEMDVILNVSHRQLSVNVTELEGSAEYNVSVRAYTSEGPGPYSNSLVQVMTKNDGTAVQLLCSYLNNISFIFHTVPLQLTITSSKPLSVLIGDYISLVCSPNTSSSFRRPFTFT